MSTAPASQREKHWLVCPPHPDLDQFAHAARIDPLLAQILLNRGVSNPADARTFLDPRFADLLAPDALPGATQAAELLFQAITDRKRIAIYGDYDVDGITATTILWHVLKLAGANVTSYVPSRFDEGYGLNTAALEQLATDGINLVITVDCGITAVAEAQRAHELGLKLIITDHHEPRPKLPDCAALVHPTARGPSANPNLSGAGVALKVAWALGQLATNARRVSPELRNALLDATSFAALGLVADVVPLIGENRIIASYGLRHLGDAKNPGLRALLEVSGITNKTRYDDFDAAFKLAPRLNAIGRMGHAQAAVELFTTAAPARAMEIAQLLDHENRQRQRVERNILKQAEAMVVERGFHRAGCHAIVLAAEDWHPGVIGIVASRLVDRFCRPSVVIALRDGVGQGSGRSIKNFPLHTALQVCDQHLIGHGGHAMAAGLRIDHKHVDRFTDAFIAEAGRRLTQQDLQPKLRIDAEVPLAALTTQLVHEIQRLAPFGAGNPRPRLATQTVTLADPPRAVGKNDAHLQFTVRCGNTHRKAIAFRKGSERAALADARNVRLAFEPLIDEWNGRKNVQLNVLDWKPAE